MEKFRFEEILQLLRQKVFKVIPECIRKLPLVKTVGKYVLDDRFFTDAIFRTAVLLYPGFTANLLYSAMQIVLAIVYHSVWFGALAVYYALLAVMRVQLLKPMKQRGQGGNILSELRRYRLCGIILLLMTPVFAGILIVVVHKNSGAHYPGITICVMAIYTLSVVTASIFNLINLRKYKRPVMSAAKIVCLIASLMSVLSLMTAVAARMGVAGNSWLRQGIIGTASGSVCVMILGIAIYMIIHATKQMKWIKMKKMNLFKLHLTDGRYVIYENKK